VSYILGPCPCQGCGKLVYFDGVRWVDNSGRRHGCYVSERRWLPLPRPHLSWRSFVRSRRVA